MLSYRQLQSALKNYRQAGHQLKVKLTANQATLQAEYDRIRQETVEGFAAKVQKKSEDNTELEQLKLELECARAIIKQQQQRIEELEQQLEQPETKAEETEVKTEEDATEVETSEVLKVIAKHEGYVSFPVLGQELKLTPAKLHKLLGDLEKQDIVELSKIAEPQEYSANDIETWGKPEISGGALFFAYVL